MKSPTQQAIIFLLEEYLKQYDGTKYFEGYSAVLIPSPEETKARELLEEVKAEDIHNDPELEGRI